MPLCPSCQKRPILDSQRPRCPFCWAHEVERLLGPQLSPFRRAVWELAQRADPRPFAQAKMALEMALARLARIDIPSHRGSLPPEADVAISPTVWHAFEAARKQYEEQVKVGGPEWEFVWLLHDAINKRRVCRHKLRRAGMDVRRGTLRCPSMNRDVIEATLQHLFAYRQHEGVLHQCLYAVFEARQANEDFQQMLHRATMAMRHIWFQGLIWQIYEMRNISVPETQEWATLALSGWMRSQIKLYKSHRKVFSESGNPSTVLLNLLSEALSQAHHENGADPHELLKTVRRQVDQLRQKSPKRGRPTRSPSSREVAKSHRQRSPERLEDWQTQEELRLVFNKLKADAKLSPKEALVLELRRAGLKFKDIAARRGVEIGTIKKEWSRIQKKFRLASSS